MRRFGVPILLALLSAPLCAQAPAQRLAFEVASVKSNKSDPQTSPSRLVISPGDRLVLTNLPLMVIVGMAFQQNGQAQFAGEPSWLRTERFDINAKAAEPVSTEQLRLMLQTLLADRFRMVVHHETREEPVYALVLARPDGKTGPNLHPVGDCVEIPADQPGPRTNQCGLAAGMTSLRARGRSLDALATLRPFIGRKVVNKTGLSGRYDFELTWEPQQGPSDNGPSINALAPAIFTAIQEQLGLKLVADKEVQDVVVLEHIERPSEN